jgi:hypothetical protein
MSKRQPKDRTPTPAPAKPDDPPSENNPCDESIHGIPPGVSFDTEAGRRAQGMDEDFDNKKRPEDLPPEDDNPQGGD